MPKLAALIGALRYEVCRHRMRLFQHQPTSDSLMPAKTQPKKAIRPAQEQRRRPGIEAKMKPLPEAERPEIAGNGRLQDQVAIITGGDSGIGRAVAIAFAKEGAHVAILYLDEHEDAQETERLVREHGRDCLLIPGDLGKEAHCVKVVAATIKRFGQLDIVVNNAAEQHPQKSILDISAEQLERTFRTNIFAMFFLTKAALPHLQEGARIINTTSVTALSWQPGVAGLFRDERCHRDIHSIAGDATG
jgi:hypothetical protein